MNGPVLQYDDCDYMCSIKCHKMSMLSHVHFFSHADKLEPQNFQNENVDDTPLGNFFVRVTLTLTIYSLVSNSDSNLHRNHLLS